MKSDTGGEPLTIRRLRGIAIGILGIGRSEFLSMRPALLLDAYGAYRSEKDSDRRHIGELFRGATARLINVQLKREHQIKDVAQFWPMPWDGAESVRKPTREECDAAAEEFLKKIGKWQQRKI